MQKKLERLKAFAFELSAIVAEMVAVFAEGDITEAETLKKSPSKSTGWFIFRSAEGYKK